jgi:hypothetical protein
MLSMPLHFDANSSVILQLFNKKNGEKFADKDISAIHLTSKNLGNAFKRFFGGNQSHLSDIGKRKQFIV